MNTTTAPTATPITATAQTARDEIAKLKAQATETLGEEFQAIAEAARTDDGRAVSLRLERHNTTADLVGTAAWLASDLVDVLHKVAAGTDPHSVMRSDLARRIHEAEVRLELLREMSR
jgi:hypothetical protein